jgi:ankyrin repeat protein
LALSYEDFAPMELLLKYGSPVGHINPVLFLLEAGADVNLVDLRGFTALHRAAEKGFNDLVGLLLERGAIPRPQAGEHTPRSLAEANGHEAIVELLRRYEDSSGM